MSNLTVLATATSKAPYEGTLGSGTLSTVLQVLPHANFTSCKKVEATLYLKLDDKARKVEAGYIVGYIIDRVASNETSNGARSRKRKSTASEPAQSNKRRRNGADAEKPTVSSASEDADEHDTADATSKTWVDELLREDRRHRHDDIELTGMMRKLYGPKGGVQKDFKTHANLLRADKVAYVDTLKLGKKYRGMGFGPALLNGFHELLPKLDDGYAFQGLVVLCPATPDSAVKDFEPLSLYEQEGKLIQFYQKAGYQLWVRGAEDEEDSVSVMGRTI